MKPLYLNPAKPTRVILDGRGLRVRVQGTADRLYPITRLSRILVSGQVNWDTDALLACAQAGISIYFIARNGTLRARLLSAAPAENWLQLQNLINNFFDLPESTERYQTWIQAQHSQAQSALMQANRERQCASTIEKLEQQLQLQTQRHARRADIRQFNCYVHTHNKIQIDEQLRTLGIDPDNAEIQINNIQLTEDLACTLAWTQHTSKIDWIRQIYNKHKKQHAGLARINLAESIRFIEAHKTAVENTSFRLLRKLLAFMLESVNSHGIQ